MKEKRQMIKGQPIELEFGDYGCVNTLIPRAKLENKFGWKDCEIIQFNYEGTYFPPEKTIELCIDTREFELIDF